MRRREFILFAAAAAVQAVPVRVRAQQKLPVIGYLNSQSPETTTHLVAAFHAGLGERGYVEGRNVAIEYRWARGRYDLVGELAVELASLAVSVIVAGGGSQSAAAARAATATIPIVFLASAEEAVSLGLVRSLGQPGGNATGVALVAAVLEQKRLELLHELLPLVRTVTVLVNPTLHRTGFLIDELREAAQLLGVGLRFLNASTVDEIEAAFVVMAQEGAEALLIGTDPWLYNQRDQVVALAAHHRIPAMYPQREYVTAGGLISYSASLEAAYRSVGRYAARILDGEDPAEMPVIQDSVFQFVINLRTASALGLTVPSGLLSVADEVLE